jgi:hypothetical protein
MAAPGADLVAELDALTADNPAPETARGKADALIRSFCDVTAVIVAAVEDTGRAR